MIIKVKFLKDGQETGRPYTYFSNEVVAVDDTVQINESAKGVVTEVDVPESEIEAFKDKVKTIVRKVVEEEYNVSKSIDAQEKYCTEKGYPHFAPASGICFRCRKQIYEAMEHERKNYQTGEVVGNYKTGITVKKASSRLITGCPHCNWSYCD